MLPKMKPDPLDVLAAHAREARQWADQSRASAAAYDEKARQIDSAMRSIRRRGGCRWVSVEKVQLVEGRLYLVRRVWGKPQRPWPPHGRDACLAEWKKNGGGWRMVVGDIPNIYKPDQSCQVWC